ncbi:monooxygenase [Clostridia bacterium]|nr:monooxygenase [Clostridia bacterium]
MLIIVAQSTLKPGMVDAYKAAVQPLIDGSRAESGNISYDLFEDANNPNVVAFIEKWQDQAAIDAHNHSPHFTEIVPTLYKFRTGEKAFNIYRQIV